MLSDFTLQYFDYELILLIKRSVAYVDGKSPVTLEHFKEIWGEAVNMRPENIRSSEVIAKRLLGISQKYLETNLIDFAVTLEKPEYYTAFGSDCHWDRMLSAVATLIAMSAVSKWPGLRDYREAKSVANLIQN